VVYAAWDDWSFPLHTGDFGGTLTRVVWVLLGLSPLMLAVTGATMYVIRLRKRAKRRRRPDDAPGSTDEGAPRRSGADVKLASNKV
jgi:uncharacterized iron-regulated membrane protein